MRKPLRGGPLCAGLSAVIGGLLILTWAAAPAFAHVSVNPKQAVAGEYAVLTFAVPHGCDGSATTAIAIQIPEPIVSAKPTVQADWTAEAIRAKLAEPQTDSHGNEITDRVDQIVYTAKTPLPDDLRQTFDVQVKLPEEAAGQTLAFPTVQTCEEGETAWVQVKQAGQDDEELEHPAPTVEVSAGEASEDAAAPVNTSWTGPAGLAAGVVGLVVGGIALFRTRRS